MMQKDDFERVEKKQIESGPGLEESYDSIASTLQAVIAD